MTVVLIVFGVGLGYALVWAMCVAAKRGDAQLEADLTVAEREWMSSRDGAT